MLRRGMLLGLVWALLAGGSAHAQGLTVTATQTLSPRLTQYTATSAALGRSTNIRVLLPGRLRGRPRGSTPSCCSCTAAATTTARGSTRAARSSSRPATR